MRLVFAGTPRFAQAALEALHTAGHDIALVLTQPDRPAGRGLHPAPSAVKRYAEGHGIDVYQPTTLKAPEALAAIRATEADAMVVAAYGLLLPESVLNATSRGAINIHASLLPRWRGAAPIQRALLAGDKQTGISIMQMDVGLDTGPVLLREPVPIGPSDDAGTLHDKLAALGAGLILRALEGIAAGAVVPEPQPEEGATYAPKIDKAETVVDWRAPAQSIDRMVRAFRPSPGASTTLHGETVKIWRADTREGGGAPGTVLASGSEGLIVACGSGAIAITELQRPGGKRLPVREFLRGRAVSAGAQLG